MRSMSMYFNFEKSFMIFHQKYAVDVCGAMCPMDSSDEVTFVSYFLQFSYKRDVSYSLSRLKMQDGRQKSDIAGKH